MNTGGNIGGLIAPVLTPFVADKVKASYGEEAGWQVAIGLACVVSAVGGLIWLWIVPPTGDTTSDENGQVPAPP